MSKPKKRAQTSAPSTLDTLADAAKRHAAQRLGNPDATDVSPAPDDYIRAARDTGNALVLAAVREELGR